MRIPETVEIFGKTITIDLTNLDDLHGDYDADKLVIRLDIKQDVDSQFKTLIHECIHAALDIGGLRHMLSGKVEEAVTRCIENGLADILEIRSE